MSHINEKNGNTKIKNGKLEYGGPLDPAASEVSAFFDDIFLYVFYFFHPFVLESLLHVLPFLFPFYVAHVHQLALVNLMLYEQLFENKFIQIYLITTNNTSESVFGKMYEQLPPLMEFVKSANGVRPSLFCIGSIMNNLFLIPDDRN
jgi:hypothetical protein